MVKQFFSGIIISIIVFSGVIFIQPNQVNAIKNFTVAIQPKTTNTAVTYTFRFVMEKPLKVHDSVFIVFPPGTTLNPPLPVDKKEGIKRLSQISESIDLSDCPCDECPGLPIIGFLKDGSMELRFNSWCEYDPASPDYVGTTITISKEAGIITPSQEGRYTFSIKTLHENIYMKSQSIGIGESTVSSPIVALTNSFQGAKSGLNIKFKIGFTGEMTFSNGNYYIVFPTQTILPSQTAVYSYDMISINGYPVLKKPLWVDKTLILPVVRAVKPGDEVIITIDDRFGIQNPFQTGQYRLEVYTSEELKKVLSEPYDILLSEYPVRVEVNPSESKQISALQITYLHEQETLPSESPIGIFFPEGFHVPAAIWEGHVRINGKAPLEIKCYENIVSIITPMAFEKNQVVQIDFVGDIGIRNPDEPGNYQFSVYYKATDKRYFSDAVLIKEPTLEITGITLSNPNSGEKATYKIAVSFHPDRIPQTGEVVKIKLAFLETIIEWIGKEPTEAKTIITLENIQNPDPGSYDLTVLYGSEKADSPYKIMILPPLPKTEIQFTGGKELKNGWFVEVPFIHFSCDDPEAKIFYEYNSRQSIVQNHERIQPQLLDTGFFVRKIVFWSEGVYGKENAQEYEFKVDLLAPVFEVNSPASKHTDWLLNHIVITGNITMFKMEHYLQDRLVLDTNLTINGVPAPVNEEDGSFSYDLSLNEGENIINIIVEDEAGLDSKKRYTIQVDSVAPVIVLNSPDIKKVWMNRVLQVSGRTEPNALLLINGEVTLVEEDGSFIKEIRLDKMGKYELVISVQDAMQNTFTKSYEFWYGYTLILVIGSNKGSVNSQIQELPVAPMIQKGRTLIPFRFIGESIGIRVGYETDPKTKQVNQVYYQSDTVKVELTIGSKVALVNGKPVTMDVPPQIINGVTLVPLRFVAENLGFDTLWEGDTQTITLRYPKL
ncbi:copper amine oxidase N-terminal domain-containing protein [bacterium]|nr:copper amine oxidase N-terminal domain-containing protein [bacterium]